MEAADRLDQVVKSPTIVFGGSRGTRVEHFESACRTGYETFGLATVYGNESAFRAGVGAHPRPRILYKVQPYRIADQVERALRLLRVEALDVLLLHHVVLGDCEPTRDQLLENWGILQAQVRAGRANSIGLSNAGPDVVELLGDQSDGRPAFDEVECNPYCLDMSLVRACRANGLVCLAYSPLGRGNPALLNESSIQSVATRAGTSPAAVCIAWLAAKEIVPVVRSTNPAHLQELMAASEAPLSRDDVRQIDELGAGHRLSSDGLKDTGLFGSLEGNRLVTPDLASYLKRSDLVRRKVDSILATRW